MAGPPDEKHSRTVPGGRGYWWTQRLWALAWMEGRTEIDAVRFPVTPEPDWIVRD